MEFVIFSERLCKVPIFFMHRLDSRNDYYVEREEGGGGCHLEGLVMASLRKNQSSDVI
jgi:hypothetical protein